MGPTLAPQTEVLFLAEAPGRYEDERTGKPLTGPSGRLVRQCVPAGKELLCGFDNVCNCRPEGNRTPIWQEIECCRPRRNSVIQDAKPKLIVGLGVVPLNFMLGTTDLTNLRGRVFAVKVGKHECHFLPTYHPDHIIKHAHNEARPLQSRLGHCFKKDIERAFDVLPTLTRVVVDSEQDIKANVRCLDGKYDEIQSLLAKATKAPIKAIDIETDRLRPYGGGRILTIAISFGDTNFSFPWNHPKAEWTAVDKEAIYKALERLIGDDTIKVAHNAPFELEWLAEEFGQTIVNHTAWECTMMQAHFLDERKGGNREDDNTGANRYLALDFLCRVNFGITYKHLFKLNKKDMGSSDLGETLLYNGVDTKYTLKLYYKQKQELKRLGLNKAYMDAVIRQPTVALMQSIGMDVDQIELKKQQKILEKDISNTETEIEALPVVQQYKKDHGQFKPIGGPDALNLFKDYLKRDEVYVKDNKNIGRYSVDRHVLEKIDHPLAKHIVHLRHVTKMKSTYVDGLEQCVGKLIYPDGKLHTTFHTTGTETGRLSSSDPNMQNFPKRADGHIRRSVYAPPGFLIVAVDYKQLEGSTTAMCSRDEYYVKALKNNYDTHMVWARRLHELWPDATNEVDGKFRSMVKNKLVFPSFFGATVESVTAYLSDGCGRAAPPAIVEKLMDEFWQTFSGVKRWQEQLMKGYYNNGYVKTLSGRRRNYPLSRNEAINHPVQGTAAELVCDAMVRLSHLASTTGNWQIHPVLNIHDDLTFVVADDDNSLEQSISNIVKEMLTFDFPWINVPLACEVSIGPNWCDLEKFGEFWSHKI